MKKLCMALVLGILLLGSSLACATSIYVSPKEATGNTLSGQILADTLDDPRRLRLNQSSNSGYYIFHTYSISGVTSPIGSGFTRITFGTGNEVLVSLRNMTGGGFGQYQTNTTTQPERNNASSLASSSPKPLSFSGSNYRNENIGSTSSKNALLFEFRNSVNGFGLWLGDVETRSNGSGALAQIQLFDASGVILNATGIVPQSGTNQSLCGGSYVGCGNSTTRFVGFADSHNIVKYMLITVGDDDASGNGNSEHLSFIGATLATYILNVVVSDLSGTNGNTMSGSFSGSLTGGSSGLNTNGTIENTGSTAYTGVMQTGEIVALTGEASSGTATNTMSGTQVTGVIINTGTLLTGTLLAGNSTGIDNLLTSGDLELSGPDYIMIGTGDTHISSGGAETGDIYAGDTEYGGNVVTGDEILLQMTDSEVIMETTPEIQVPTNVGSPSFQTPTSYISNGTPYVRIPLPGEKYVSKIRKIIRIPKLVDEKIRQQKKISRKIQIPIL